MQGEKGIWDLTEKMKTYLEYMKGKKGEEVLKLKMPLKKNRNS